MSELFELCERIISVLILNNQYTKILFHDALEVLRVDYRKWQFLSYE